MADRTNIHSMLMAVGGEAWDYQNEIDQERHYRKVAPPSSARGRRSYGEFLSGYEHPQWMLDASCAGVDESLYFPEAGEKVLALTRRVCRMCPVAGECFEYAMADESIHGFWGGTGKDDRDRLRGKTVT
jgi:WhiB family transcriptional regulator, redox-sensing transcriptional regulator